MIICFNGRFVHESKAAVSVTDRGFTLGDGVFDTMLAVDDKLQYAPEHFERLLQHCRAMQIDFTDTAETFGAMAQQLLQKNKLTEGRHAIRTTVTRGPGARGLAPPENATPTVVMRASPAPEPDNMPPVKAMIVKHIRRNEFSPLSRIKSLNYGDNIIALIEAQQNGYNDAILLNTKGNVCCASAANIFIEENGKLITPPLEDGAMDGITRAQIIAEKNATEESITPERLYNADAVYLTNSITGMRQAVSIDDAGF